MRTDIAGVPVVFSSDESIADLVDANTMHADVHFDPDEEKWYFYVYNDSGRTTVVYSHPIFKSKMSILLYLENWLKPLQISIHTTY